jgi:hypothetical protein
MGELMRQIAAGGPGLLPLTPAQRALADSLAREPARWAFEIGRPEIMDRVREATMAGRVGFLRPSTLPLEELAVAVATQDGSEQFARTLLCWLGGGPSFLKDADRVFARAVRERAAWERANATGEWWQGGPIQIMDGLVEGGEVAGE